VLAGLGLGLAGERVWAIYLFGAIGTASAWSLSVLMPCLVADTIKAEERGKVLGWLHFVWNGGMLVGSLLGGALFAWRAGAPFLVAATMNLGAVALAMAFFRDNSGPPGLAESRV
jgi:DHA1 family tetracycline resistance protein-like MFS transporter